MINLNDDNIELIQKLVLITSGFFVLVFKVKSYFSLIKQKQDLKQDIEILDLLKRQNNTNTQNIEKKIETDLNKIYDPNQKHDNGFFGFVTGTTFFIGFGWWSFSIYNNNQGFNGWIILTMFFSLFGLSTILIDTSFTKKNEPFLKIGFFEKGNLRAGIILFLVSGFTFMIMFIKLNSFSIWEILLGMIFLYGTMMIIKNIRRIK